MSLKHGLLGFLSEQEMSGYDLEKLFRSSIGHFWNAKISQVYRDLHAMERTGWVQSSKVIQTDKPNKRVFRITDAGRKELENWLITYDVKNDFQIRIGILMRMFFAAKRPKEETIALLERFRSACYDAIDPLNNINKEFDSCDIQSMEMFYSRTTLSYGAKYYQMQIDWCTETIEKLQKMAAKRKVLIKRNWRSYHEHKNKKEAYRFSHCTFLCRHCGYCGRGNHNNDLTCKHPDKRHGNQPIR